MSGVGKDRAEECCNTFICLLMLSLYLRDNLVVLNNLRQNYFHGALYILHFSEPGHNSNSFTPKFPITFHLLPIFSVFFHVRD